MFKGQGRKVISVLIIAFLIFSAGFLGFLIRDVSADNQLLAEVPDQFRTFKSVLSIVDQHYVEEVDVEKLLTGAIDGMLEALDDPYTSYLSSSEYQDMQSGFEGEFGGIGIEVTMREDRVMVVSPIKGTPGDEAGLQAGDVIAEINGESTEGMSLDEAVNLMRGEPDSEIELRIKRGFLDESGEESDEELETFSVNIIRDIIEISYVDSEIKADKLGYIRVAQFGEGIGKEVASKLAEFEGTEVEGIILDLRNNPGGILHEAVDLASNFVSNGSIVHIKQRDSGEETLLSNPDIEPTQLPVVVLINKGSASGSEIVAGAIQDTQSGTLIGNQTFGKGAVQSIVPLDGGSALKLTTARYFTSDGRDINEKGIEPDLEVKFDLDTEEDEQLDKAIEYLLDKLE
ncbi:S41 family peptidase [Fuchsiella alkaliacetigena]|uniref:S41 family peptidase n=1 Tax=Fuchsiella alkaliacetigena TaxID=957042 RepID=UPI00200B1DC8|nr:S41 family peptidase [Fuchsiella alkaliacetigena]MCK8824087.1 S41 family peptidase [Fuchsiella alkaliacetigena]